MEWLGENWVWVSLVANLVVIPLLIKWGLIRQEAATAIMGALEAASHGKVGVNNVPGNFQRVENATLGAKLVKQEVRALMESAPASVREFVRNEAAELDPDPAKLPESKGRRAAKFLGRAALGILLRGVR